MSNSLFVACRSDEPANAQWGPVGRLDRGAGGYRFIYTNVIQWSFRPNMMNTHLTNRKPLISV